MPRAQIACDIHFKTGKKGSEEARQIFAIGVEYGQVQIRKT